MTTRPDDLREVTFTIDFPTVTACATFIRDLDELLPDRLPDRAVEQTLAVTVHTSTLDLPDLSGWLRALAEDHDAELMGWQIAPP